MKTNFRYLSPENGLDDLDLGIMGLLPWRAEVHVIEGTFNILKATAIYTVDEEEKEIEITNFIRGEWNAKEAIRKQWESECAELLKPDEDRPYDEYVDREREGA